ncbi:hypothetical protein JCM4814A_00560 [Streptomyces phaeofaciens JCM 4814]|uniref:Uncharacterized protein n=1 Tax=Streptomyces phaeofaciens TaxID=68254 RepID=A0A918HQY9_9ACTN|nr:hypothetical protein GCM10010226_87780 [Streptomyces phaeofaciens]
MREAADVEVPALCLLGTIPAGAGSGPGRYPRDCLMWDRPRSRGEQLLCQMPMHPIEGPSPLTRRTAARRHPGGHTRRNIPPQAGEQSAWEYFSAEWMGVGDA